MGSTLSELFWDVSGDGQVPPLDVLQVIDNLNASADRFPSAVGEAQETVAAPCGTAYLLAVGSASADSAPATQEPAATLTACKQAVPHGAISISTAYWLATPVEGESPAPPHSLVGEQLVNTLIPRGRARAVFQHSLALHSPALPRSVDRMGVGPPIIGGSEESHTCNGVIGVCSHRSSPC